MNRQAYIRRVKRALILPRRQKAEILRDLSEIFASAREHGESDAQIIARLGAPELFAREAQAPFGDAYARRRAALEWALASVLLLAALFMLLLPPRGSVRYRRRGRHDGDRRILARGRAPD